MKTYAFAFLLFVVDTFWEAPSGRLHSASNHPVSDLDLTVPHLGLEEATPNASELQKGSQGNATGSTRSTGDAAGAGLSAHQHIPLALQIPIEKLQDASAYDLLTWLFLLVEIWRSASCLRNRIGCCRRRARDLVTLEQSAFQTDLTDADILQADKDHKDLQSRFDKKSQECDAHSTECKTFKDRLAKAINAAADKTQENRVLKENLLNTRNDLQQLAQKKMDLEKQKEEQAKRIKSASEELRDRNSTINNLTADNKHLESAQQAAAAQLQREQEEHALARKLLEELEAKPDVRVDAAEQPEAEPASARVAAVAGSVAGTGTIKASGADEATSAAEAAGHRAAQDDQRLEPGEAVGGGLLASRHPVALGDEEVSVGALAGGAEEAPVGALAGDGAAGR
eukprot:CAMPEP_0171190314 /NCGR_PEP_ID=MMETSP0790-20130122/18793_1 /TAXON_ID=2925 /ORGANISM="Alexandrium catenella, Strain OF101" /LENGTH=397 /DNA_ID=CAMNT_0011655443 /DNA_START=47 /DNA_END=1235 /DNA_ORIENTATION=-